ncbi:myeloid-associated differentiation marker homolog [Austrofundulus limnaeus]|uniref:Myeloid-associated differentiation marker homolog n=1 Tax=Austrofundulus limnaeus TaxID=52670 RepID=A0A2I4C1X4_AUSLI|nr:PREDICTED: myeloid-associated differentiation marker homolog [Austrofundulus limnaeus]
MPVIVLEARDFSSPLFIVRTLEVLSCCTVFSLVASMSEDLNPSNFSTFRVFCMFTWCFFFVVTLFIHLLNTIQFHNLIRISWKNLTMTVAVMGALMSFSSSAVFPWMVMDHQKVSARAVAAAVISGLTTLAYASEFFVLRCQADEQKGYMGSTPGLLKILQLWGGVQMIPLVVFILRLSSGLHHWQLWLSCTSYGVCVLMSLVTLVVILGDFAGRCLLPFDKFLACFSLIGVLLYMTATVICLTKILQLNGQKNSQTDLVIMETVVSSVTLLAYTVDLAFAIKLLCDRSHM